MIHSFSCKNFYSFNKEVFIDFLVDENAPKNDTYIRDGNGRRVSLVEAVIGPNASGKTNILKVLPMLQYLIVDSWNSNPQEGIPLKVFRPNQRSENPTELTVTFNVGSSTYRYEVHLDTTRILYESLGLQSLSKKRFTTKTLLKREYDPLKKSYRLETKGFNAPHGFSAVLRDNATALSTGFRLNHRLSREIAAYWEEVEFNVVELGYIGDHAHGDRVSAGEALRFFHLNTRLKKRAEEILARYDLGFNSFEIEEGQNNELIFRIAHDFGKQAFRLPLSYESTGTKQLFALLKPILLVLETGGIAVLDEFDARLHPDMVQELVGLFTDKTTNPKRSQLLFSTHSHKVLSQLDKYQIILTEKNKLGETEAWRLDDMKGVRPNDNYYTKYMSGAYGAIPQLK